MAGAKQFESMNDHVARKLIGELCRNQGTCNFVPQIWNEFYLQACRDHQSNQVQKYVGSDEDDICPKASEFLSHYKHIFAYNERAGGRLIEVRANVRLGACESYLQKGGSCNDKSCRKLHCCGFFLAGTCARGIFVSLFS
jgi:hypothetical protein